MAITNYCGQTIEGRYRIDKLLGKGGMGAVYLGRHIIIGKKVAVKFLHSQYTQNEQIVKRFYREAQTAAAITHKNIIDVLDVGVSDKGDPYLVMEYLEGESLAAMLARADKVDLAAACGILEPTLLALSAAHSKGVVHRDLKPENIFLVQQDDGSPQVKIIDFGISKLTHGGENFTQTGTLLGTPAYMSPEQARGDTDIDYRSDLYSVGVILYEMLSGKMPFSGDNYSSHLVAVVTSEPTPPKKSYPGFPEEAEELVLRALSKNPANRHQSAIEMLTAVKKLENYDQRDERLTHFASGVVTTGIAGGDVGENVSTERGNEPVAVDVLNQISTGDRLAVTASDSAVSMKKNRVTLPLALAGAGLVLATAAVIVFVMGKTDSPPTFQPELVPLSANPTPTTVAPDLPNPAAVAKKEQHQGNTIRIEIQGAPKGATYHLGDRQIEDNPFELDRSNDTKLLAIRAPGYVTYNTALTPSQNHTIHVQMRKGEDPKEDVASKSDAKDGSSRAKSKPGSRSKSGSKTASKEQTTAEETPSSVSKTDKETTSSKSSENAFETGRRGTKIVRDWDSNASPTPQKKSQKSNRTFHKNKKGTTFGKDFE